MSVCVCVRSVCLARGEGVRPSVCRINIIKGNFQSAAVTKEGARAAHASSATAAQASNPRRRCRFHTRTTTPQPDFASNNTFTTHIRERIQRGRAHRVYYTAHTSAAAAAMDDDAAAVTAAWLRADECHCDRRRFD